MTLPGRASAGQVLAFSRRAGGPLEQRLVALLSSGPFSVSEAASALAVGDQLEAVHQGLAALVRKGVARVMVHSDGVPRYGYRPRQAKPRWATEPNPARKRRTGAHARPSYPRLLA